MKDYKIKVSVSGDFDTIVRAENPVMALKILADEFSSMKFKMTLDKENVDFISLESSDETIGENTSKVSTFLSKTDGFKMKDF